MAIHLTEKEFNKLNGKETKRSKYGNEKVTINGIDFDSKREGEFYQELGLRKTGQGPKIRGEEIKIQPEFLLQEAFEDKDGNKHRAIKYIADFEVRFMNGDVKVYDVKGCITNVYKLKKKLFLYKYPHINFVEIT